MTKNSCCLPQTRDPFTNLLTRFFGDAAQEYYAGGDQHHNPLLDVSESDKAYELRFEMPGLQEQNIEVQFHDHTLTVSAERADDRRQDGKRWHRAEHRYGRMTRSILLPKDATGTGVEAVYKAGVLNVTVPKAPEAQPSKICVRSN